MNQRVLAFGQLVNIRNDMCLVRVPLGESVHLNPCDHTHGHGHGHDHHDPYVSTLHLLPAGHASGPCIYLRGSPV